MSSTQSLPRWSQQSWMDFAVCVGQTHLFFPAPGEREPARRSREAAARSLCGSCPVQDACAEYARRHLEHGFWGNESEDERVLAGYAPAHPVGASRLRRAARKAAQHVASTDAA
ncbi:MAG: WhiB family transcriptional regulator [Acidimicrobiia bacterium]|nr:WhiB family transcriptional regulator [Acidimicrobiia bacterium]